MCSVIIIMGQDCNIYFTGFTTLKQNSVPDTTTNVGPLLFLLTRIRNEKSDILSYEANTSDQDPQMSYVYLLFVITYLFQIWN